MLPLYFALSDEHAAKSGAYTRFLEASLKDLITKALGNLVPATLGRGCAMAGLALGIIARGPCPSLPSPPPKPTS